MILKTENELIIKIPSDDPAQARALIYALAYKLLEEKKLIKDEKLTEALNDIIRAIDPEGRVLSLALKGYFKAV